MPSTYDITPHPLQYTKGRSVVVLFINLERRAAS